MFCSGVNGTFGRCSQSVTYIALHTLGSIETTGSDPISMPVNFFRVNSKENSSYFTYWPVLYDKVKICVAHHFWPPYVINIGYEYAF